MHAESDAMFNPEDLASRSNVLGDRYDPEYADSSAETKFGN